MSWLKINMATPFAPCYLPFVLKCTFVFRNNYPSWFYEIEYVENNQDHWSTLIFSHHLIPKE